MSDSLFARIEPITTMQDGTLKQINPFSGTEVWTVPGRGNRPIETDDEAAKKLTKKDRTHRCAFCAGRMLETPPEKARMLDDATILRGVLHSQLETTQPAFRRVANLFEILSFDYWNANYGYTMDELTRTRMNSYLAEDGGRKHVLDTMRFKRKASGKDPDVSDRTLLKEARGFFGGGHDLIIGRDHFQPGATKDNQLESAGTLTPEQHNLLTAFTVDSIRDLYERNRYAPYVAAFQNWLAPAGASFEHLHKQLVAVDERGLASQREVQLLRKHPNMYNEWGTDYAAKQNLVIAENEHAILYAGFGHRYPTLEIFSKSATPEPWLQSPDEVTSMSDLLHAAHAAMGPAVPCNEEWHHKPADVDIPMPWRIMVKLRISTLAGFEGGTKIYINTITPWQLRDRVVDRLYKLRDQGKVARGMRIATECMLPRNALAYNPLL